jgi:hypothetical protein
MIFTSTVSGHEHELLEIFDYLPETRQPGVRYVQIRNMQTGALVLVQRVRGQTIGLDSNGDEVPAVWLADVLNAAKPKAN